MKKFNENIQNEKKVSIQLEKEVSGKVFITIAPTKMVSVN